MTTVSFNKLHKTQDFSLWAFNPLKKHPATENQKPGNSKYWVTASCSGDNGVDLGTLYT
jgi:hypothetical protein